MSKKECALQICTKERKGVSERWGPPFQETPTFGVLSVPRYCYLSSKPTLVDNQLQANLS